MAAAFAPLAGRSMGLYVRGSSDYHSWLVLPDGRGMFHYSKPLGAGGGGGCRRRRGPPGAYRVKGLRALATFLAHGV